MPNYQDVVKISETAERVVKITLASGFDFREIRPEPEYADLFKTHPSGVSARYHFIEMITEGGHGIDRPMTDAEIIKNHGDLTVEKITTLRNVYASNKSRRPFKVPLETNVTPIENDILVAANRNLDDFFLYFRTVNPLVINIQTTNVTEIPRQSILDAQRSYGSRDMKFGGPTAPLVANVGDMWLNTITDRIFFYITDGSTGGSSGVGMTSAWVEL